MAGQEEPRFIADSMLGSLARWLRLIGYDTLYDPAAADRELVHRARAEARILLTRDRPLAARRGVRTLFIDSQTLAEQMRQVITAFGLRLNEDGRRCSVCNGPLQRVDPAAVRERVPPYVLRTHTLFRACADCGRVYWPGTHWQELEAQLARLLK